MIEGLQNLLDDSNLPGLPELRAFLQELLGGARCEGRLADRQKLTGKAFRLRFVLDGERRSLIVKHLRPAIARKNELVATRWLSLLGIDDGGPPLLGIVAARNGDEVWHVYEDLGPWQLDMAAPDRERIRNAVALAARIHTRAEGHPLLGEIRLHGGDLGVHFLECSVRDALHALRAWHAEAQDRALREGLLERLERLRDELPMRARVIATHAGPETLVHGDLWTVNVFAIPTPSGIRARLIDWDDAGVGPASYDLSTFLHRMPVEYRLWVLDLYRSAATGSGWRLPSCDDLNLLFDTHECARIASTIIWPAIALATERASWGVAALSEIETWFVRLAPVLPVETAAGPTRPPCRKS